MKKSIQLNMATSWYLIFLICWGVSVTFAMSLESKADLFLTINHFRNPLLDITSTVFTYIGDGLFTVMMLAFFLVTARRRLAWILLCSFLLSTVFCHLFKNLYDELRPAGFFKDPSIVKSVSWVSLKRFNSFPSGHTTTAFATATILAFYYKKVWVSVICFLSAVLVGYSRVYLGEHFVGDVFTGSIIGTLSSFICILNYNSLIVKKGLGLEYLFKKKELAVERNMEGIV